MSIITVHIIDELAHLTSRHLHHLSILPLLVGIVGLDMNRCRGESSYICCGSPDGSLSRVWSIRNMSIVSSENFACSELLPIINTSCRDKVIWGDLSTGGVMRLLSLKLGSCNQQ